MKTDKLINLYSAAEMRASVGDFDESSKKLEDFPCVNNCQNKI